MAIKRISDETRKEPLYIIFKSPITQQKYVYYHQHKMQYTTRSLQEISYIKGITCHGNLQRLFFPLNHFKSALLTIFIINSLVSIYKCS